MKTIVFILFVSSVWTSFTQSSQAGTNLEHEFSNTTLEAKHILAFENRAKQKVRDFCNYIQLISDKSYDEKFRAHSKKTALALFNSTECTIVDSLISGEQSGIGIEDYFIKILQTNYSKIVGEATDIVLSQDLAISPLGSYFGTISYTHHLKFYDKKDRLIQAFSEKKEVGVTLSRKTKAFGDTEKIIWVVNLCDIILA